MEDLRLYRKKEIKNMEKNKIAFLMNGGNAVRWNGIKEKWKHPLLKYIYKNYNVYVTPNTPTDRIAVKPHPSKPDFNRPQLHCFRVE